MFGSTFWSTFGPIKLRHVLTVGYDSLVHVQVRAVAAAAANAAARLELAVGGGAHRAGDEQGAAGVGVADAGGQCGGGGRGGGGGGGGVRRRGGGDQGR